MYYNGCTLKILKFDYWKIVVSCISMNTLENVKCNIFIFNINAYGYLNQSLYSTAFITSKYPFTACLLIITEQPWANSSIPHRIETRHSAVAS